MKPPFTLRAATQEDIPFINLYAYSEGMDAMPTCKGITVAVDGDDDVIGFIRIAFGNCDIAHVNPIVIAAPWRRRGVGRALIENARATYGELRLVARGSSIPFYTALGFENISWNDITKEVVDDCEGCTMRNECRPQPMGCTCREIT